MHSRLIVSIVLCTPLVGNSASQLLVPAYFDPSSDSADWNTLTASVSKQVPITAIMNPYNGPVSTVDPSYTNAISSLQTAGGKVIAYVHTTDGQRSITAVENDVATYKSEYPNINGIFIDEMDTSSAELSSYYMPLYSYIKSQNANWEVVGNPGTSTMEGYLSPAPAAADVLVTFEDSVGYTTYSPSSWQSSFPITSFGNIATSQAGVATMQNDVNISVADRAANIYFTDLGGTNPYATLPSYWSQEVAAVRAINVAPKATYVSTGSGDYNSASNWSSAIPNAIDAEADLLGAITGNRTVYSDVAVTAGKIIFNNTKSYVLAGAGSLTLQTSLGSAMVDAQAGTQKITLPITIASNTVFSAETGGTLLIDAPVLVNSNQTLSESGGGKISFLSTVTVQAGGVVSLIAGSSVQSLILTSASQASVPATTAGEKLASQVGTLSVSSLSKLDLNNNDLIVHNGDLSEIQSQIGVGLNANKGIVSSSSTTDSSHLKTLAVISNSSTSFATFDGTAINYSDILIKYISFGDANFDGVVDSADYGQLNTGYHDGSTGWFNGDFNDDGIVNGSDYTLIDNAYNASDANNSSLERAVVTTQLASPVPEPIGVLVSLTAVIALRRRHLIAAAAE